jgi:hypothetical protein
LRAVGTSSVFPNRLPCREVYTSSKEVAMVRVSTVALALACLVTGYALAGTRVNALEDVSSARRLPSGIGAVGTHVTLWFASDPKRVTCTIARIDAGWVRCAPEQGDGFGPTFGPTPQLQEEWYDLGHVVGVTKRETQR